MTHKVLHFDIINNTVEPNFFNSIIEKCKELNIKDDWNNILKDYQNTHADNLANQDIQNNEEWIPFLPFQTLLVNIHNSHGYYVLKDLAKDVLIKVHDLYMEDEYNIIQQVILNLGTIYKHLIRGDKLGLWQIENLSNGFVVIKENTGLPGAFIEGFLLGVLKACGAVGVKVNLVTEQNMESYFNIYEVAWMRNLVS